MRKKRVNRNYAIQIGPSARAHIVSRVKFYARLSVGVTYRPDAQRKPKLARVSPGYRAWVEDGELCIRRWEPWVYWRAMLAAKIRTNAEIIEQLAILAIGTPWATELERQREAALQYLD